MSYTRRYTEVVSKSFSFRYPASQNGGTMSETVSIPVDVEIHVDTAPFDKSIEHCNHNVNLLTGAVVATEAAEIISKERNSKRVADTVIGGFFGYIRSEISQQIAELTQSIDAQLMHLHELMKSCLQKKDQMQGDFMRISGRYEKIFGDLNHELSNRIFELDKQAFLFKKITDSQNTRNTSNDMVSTISVFGSESGGLQGKVSASIAKKRAHQALDKATVFLWKQKQLNQKISQSMLNEKIATKHYLPACFVETIDVAGIERKVLVSDYLKSINESELKSKVLNQLIALDARWERMPEIQKETVSRYFYKEIDKHSLVDNDHSRRLSETIKNIAKMDVIEIIKQH